MKKFLLLPALASMMLAGVSSADAQEVVVAEEVSVESLTDVTCKNYYSNDWRKNWFIQVGAGAHMPFVEDTRINHGWYHQISAAYNIGFGKWWSPYFGFRFTGFYATNHWGVEGPRDYFAKSKTGSLNVEIMWDLLNSACGYKADRVFSIIPFFGFGGAFTWDFDDDNIGNVTTRHGDLKDNIWDLPVSAGFQFRFRLSKYVDFFAEGRFMFHNDTWNRWAVNRPFDIDAMAIGGFNFNIGGREFKAYNPCDYVNYINTLNGQINDLRGALATTAAALAAAEAQLPCPEVKPCPEAPKAKAAPMLSAVRFKINSAVVSNQEMVNVYNVAQYMKDNPDVKVRIQGYADRDTGTAAYNMKLSERRTQSVYDILVNEYGINPDRLVRNHFGSDVQPYAVNNWNRIVLFVE